MNRLESRIGKSWEKKMLLSIVLGSLTLARADASDGLLLKVCDVGPGLACVARVPDESGYRYLVYDAGHWNYKRLTKSEIGEVLPERVALDWLIISHTDGDHIAIVEQLLSNRETRRIVWPDNPRSTDVWRSANTAISTAKTSGVTVFTPEEREVRAGTAYRIGKGVLRFLGGHSKPPTNWGLKPGTAEYNNAGSVIVALEYAGRRILLTGDAVGRHIGGPANQCIASELSLVRGRSRRFLKSDVLIAAHHGADNGSSKRFVNAVRPTKVVFSAGHDHHHPTTSAAERFTVRGLHPLRDIFRTDVGDREGSREWFFEHPDPLRRNDVAGRDDVEISISPNGEVDVRYSSIPGA